MPDPEFEPPDRPELLSLGLIVGGNTPSNELVREAFIALMRGVRDQRDLYQNEGLRLNIVFQIPGPFATPDFEGVSVARYARKTNHLLVNAAVPESLQLEHVRDYFVQTLQETKTAVGAYLKKRRIDVETTQVMAFIDDLGVDPLCQTGC